MTDKPEETDVEPEVRNHNKAIATWIYMFPDEFIGREITWRMNTSMAHGILKGTISGARVIECGCVMITLSNDDFVPEILLERGKKCEASKKMTCSVPSQVVWDIFLVDELPEVLANSAFQEMLKKEREEDEAEAEGSHNE